MEWIDKLEASIEYIEKNLTGKIDPKELGRIACCSSYHYQRIFSYMTNTSLAEYIRRRKMSLAGVDLQQGAKVIDVAMKYGYESPDSFTCAFKKIHGILPSEAQKEGSKLRSFPKIKFHITIKGDVEMEYRIENKEAFKIIGLKKRLSADLEENFQEVPELWEEFSSSGAIEKLLPLMDTEMKGILGVTTGFATDSQDDMEYYVAVASSQKTPSEFADYQIAAFKWAIFSGSGAMPNAIQELEQRIITEWLPSSGYEYADGPDIEVYLKPDPKDALFEVWIPVVKK